MADPFATPEDFATYLRRDVDTASAVMFLAAASETIRDYCRWDITAASGLVAVLDSDGARVISLPCLHVTAVDTVQLDGITLTADVDYTWSEMGAVARKHHAQTYPNYPLDYTHDWFCYGWPRGYRRVTVTYNGGYDTIPPELTLAACSIASRAMIQPVGATQIQETVGGVATNYQFRTNMQNAKLTGAEQIVCDRYRIPGRP